MANEPSVDVKLFDSVAMVQILNPRYQSSENFSGNMYADIYFNSLCIFKQPGGCMLIFCDAPEYILATRKER